MIQIIPAIDVIGGECVRLTQGDYAQKTTYYRDPLEIALRYESIGVKRLHVVDLDGAKAAKPVNLAVLERISSKTGLEVQYGGGIKSEEALQSVFDSGARRAICGSVAVTQPEQFTKWLTRFGSEKVILGADVRDGFVAINGWLEAATMSAVELIEKFRAAGLSQVICTDISKDGMLQGPSFDLYTSLQERFAEVDITVSGGISSLDDILKLNELGLRSVIVGKAIYEGHITFNQLKECLQNE